MNVFKLLGITSLLAVLTMPAMAHPQHGGGIEQRLQRQETRIHHGLHSGALTAREAKRLRKQQRELKVLLRVFRRDGRLGRGERRLLNRELDRTSALIMKLKHNRRQAGHGPHRDKRHTWQHRHHDYRNRHVH